MSTPYTDIIPFVRAATGDFGTKDQQGTLEPNSYDYDDETISLTINLALLKYPSFSGDGTDITPEVTADNDKGSIAYYTALLLVLPAGTFTLDVPNLHYRQVANQDLLANILGELSYYNNEGAAMPATWGSIDKALNEGRLIANRLETASNRV